MDTKQLIGSLTGNTFDAWRIAGPSNTKNRQSVMLALTGNKLPIAKCGVNAIRAAMCAAAGINASTLAICEIDHLLWAWGNDKQDVTREQRRAEQLAALKQSLGMED